MTIKGEGLLDARFPDGETKNRYVAKELAVTRQRGQKLKKTLITAELIDDDWQPLLWDEMHGANAFTDKGEAAGKETGCAMTGAERTKKCRDNKKAAVTNAVTPVTNAVTPVTNAVTPVTNERCTERYKASENHVENQQVKTCNAPLKKEDLDLDLDVDLDSEKDLKNPKSKSIARGVASDPPAPADEAGGDLTKSAESESRKALEQARAFAAARRRREDALALEARSTGHGQASTGRADARTAAAEHTQSQGQNADANGGSVLASPLLTAQAPPMPRGSTDASAAPIRSPLASVNGGATFAEPFHKPSPKPKPKPKPNADADADAQRMFLCKNIWANYSTAYLVRYGKEPVRNQAINAQVLLLAKRLGKDAPAVAAHYVGIHDGWLIRTFHPFGQLLKGYEGYHTQWATGDNMNSESPRLS